MPNILARLLKSPRETLREEQTLVKFVIVGASGVVVNEVILIALAPFLGKLVAQSIGVEISILNNFLWNDTFTFKDNTKQMKGKSARKIYRLLKYNGLSLGTFALNLLVYVLLLHFGVYYIASSLIAIIVAFVFNYFGSSRWAWRYQSTRSH